MCGIVGYLGKKVNISRFIDLLSNIEYRGYDSCGILFQRNNTLTLKKYNNLLQMRNNIKSNIKSDLILGHVRWATNGDSSLKYAHPIQSINKKVSVVHNGIVTNADELRNKYLSNYKHIELDTEIIANYIEKNMYMGKEKAIEQLIGKIEGSSAICLSFENDKSFYCATKDCSLIVGKGDKGFYVSSDICSIKNQITAYQKLENDKVYKLSSSGLFVGDQKIKNWIFLSYDRHNLAKKYKDNLINEIKYQATSSSKILSIYVCNNDVTFNFSDEFNSVLKSVPRIYIVGSGSSFNAGLIGKYFIEKYTGIMCLNMFCSEILYNEYYVDKDGAYIFISQSGETLDILNSCQKILRSNKKVIIITNNEFSALYNYDCSKILLFAGDEISVASTKTYTSSTIILFLLAVYISKLRGGKDACKYINKLKRLPNEIRKILSKMQEIKKIANRIIKFEKIIFSGDCLDASVLREADLKFKELTYINSHSILLDEIKHGELAVIDEKTLVISLFANNLYKNKFESGLNLIKARNGSVIAFSFNTEFNIDGLCFDDFDSDLLPIVSIIPFQLLSYFVAKKLNNNVDRPRNLAKCITV